MLGIRIIYTWLRKEEITYHTGMLLAACSPNQETDWSGSVVLTQCYKASWRKGNKRAEQTALARASPLALHHLWMFWRRETHMRTRMKAESANIVATDESQMEQFDK